MSLAGPWKAGDSVDFDVYDEISHVVGSSKQKPSPQSSWVKYWLAHSGRQWPNTCQIKGCSNQATLGAHIYIKRQGLQENFILPACIPCNNSAEEHYDGANTVYCKPNAGSRAVWVDRHLNTYG